MSGEQAAVSLAEAEPDALTAAFVVTLVRVMRAHDAHGVWAKKSDAQLLEPFVVTKEQRRQIPIIADPDRRVVWRVEQFYNAIGLSVEQATGVMASPLIKLSHEGYGRVVMTAGRLVVLNRNLRDIHRFGFETLADLAKEGSRLVNEAVSMIETYPEIAKL